jgi:hypothetical protein
MNYQVWDVYYPGSGFAWVEEIGGLSDEQESNVFFGRPLAPPLPRVAIKRLTKGKLPDVLGAATASRLVSAALRDVIVHVCPEGVQFLPTTSPRKLRITYFMANTTTHLACFDHDRSQYQRFPVAPHTIRAVKKMELKPIPPHAPALFHLAELPAVILVRDELRQAIQSASTSPGTFTPVDQFTSGVW